MRPGVPWPAFRLFPVTAILAALAGGGPSLVMPAPGLAQESADSLTVKPGADPSFPDIEVPRYLFAAEDTLDLPALFHMSEVEIRASRLEIGDIVQRCIESEEKLRASIDSHVFTQAVRTVMHVDGYGESAKKRMVREQLDRVYTGRSGANKAIPLKADQYVLEGGERRPWEDDEDSYVRFEYDELNDLPFYLEEKNDYDFEILSREIVGNRVIYEVRLTPRSDFEIAPHGRIWVDTSTFRILREEFDFGDRVPMPMFVKSLGPFIRERERVDGLWVWKRFLIRVEFRLGWMRRFDEDVPDVVEFMVSFRDHRVNQGWETPEREAVGEVTEE